MFFFIIEKRKADAAFAKVDGESKEVEEEPER
jgi:hypothetical protein